MTNEVRPLSPVRAHVKRKVLNLVTGNLSTNSRSVIVNEANEVSWYILYLVHFGRVSRDGAERTC